MSGIPLVESERPFSRFEQMVIGQQQMSHNQFCETRFQNIEDLVEDVQYKIGQMFYGPND